MYNPIGNTEEEIEEYTEITVNELRSTISKKSKQKFETDTQQPATDQSKTKTDL